MKIRSAKTAAVLTVIHLCFCTSEVKAQYELILSSGVTLPREPEGFRRRWNTGYNFGVELILPNDDPNFLFSVNLNALGFSLGEGNFTSITSSEQIKNNNSVVTVMSNLTAIIPLKDNVKLNVIAGMGFLFFHSEVVSKELDGVGAVSYSKNGATRFGVKIGTGLEIPLFGKNSAILRALFLKGFKERDFDHVFSITFGWKIKI